MPRGVISGSYGSLTFSLRNLHVCVHAKSLQSCPALCGPMDCSPPSSCIHGILQARILVWRKGNPLFFFLLLSIVVVPIYITTNSVGGFPFLHILSSIRFSGGSAVKNPPANAGDARDSCSIPVLERSPGKGNDNPLQYSCWICRLQSIVFQRVRQD